ncbi:hypothetical protein [Vibrio sp. SCSIO 43136]|uniref:hypothetical protein n=1 Tax=Vibrio sp. SCSIO 43136 TaxID=2819101 RepID=UPI0020751AD5|nr:hypothetical protein [Vibrio sp. SCSIO 43136]USD66787.1 hypothetical protein J4N39_19210 [Vibrio sp. SCSIO 43136]
MTTLYQHLQSVGATELELVPQEQMLLDEICTKYQPLFNNACRQNPTKPLLQMLLGTLTHAHVESSSTFENQLDSLINMKQVIDENLESEHRDKFKAHGPEELLLITKLWVMIQGYLRMDFSLANDHADKTANLVTHLVGADPDILRTSIMKSYYIGQQTSPIEAPKPNLLSRVLNWFSPTS